MIAVQILVGLLAAAAWVGFIYLVIVEPVRLYLRRDVNESRDEQNTRFALYPEPRHFDSQHRPRVGISNEIAPAAVTRSGARRHGGNP